MDKKVALILVGVLAAIGVIVVGQSVASRDSSTTALTTAQDGSTPAGCPKKAVCEKVKALGDKACDSCGSAMITCSQTSEDATGCCPNKKKECDKDKVCEKCGEKECKCEKPACGGSCCPKKPAPEKPDDNKD